MLGFTLATEHPAQDPQLFVSLDFLNPPLLGAKSDVLEKKTKNRYNGILFSYKKNNILPFASIHEWS